SSVAQPSRVLRKRISPLPNLRTEPTVASSASVDRALVVTYAAGTMTPSVPRSLSALIVVCAFAVAPAFARSPGSATAGSAPAHSPPASMEEIAIPSGDSRMNGLLYLAAGAGPHPVVIFLHGYPGNERNLDLAQAVRRAGYHALYLDYRGAWGSGGTFSFTHGLEDVAAALAWVKDPANAAKYHFDSRHLALVGHSFGGWLALLSGAREPNNVCVAALAAW